MGDFEGGERKEPLGMFGAIGDEEPCCGPGETMRGAVSRCSEDC